jgi:nitrogen fixation NifU-like protein
MNKSKVSNEYSRVVAEHMRNPRNWGILSQSDGYGRITGPCGDTMEISLIMEGDMIKECTFDTDGCGATVACGSIVSEMATGKTIAEARRIDQAAVLSYCEDLPDGNKHCALLTAETLQKAIEDCTQTRTADWKRLYRIR